MWLWRLCACSVFMFCCGKINSQYAPTQSSVSKRDIDMTATAQIKIDDYGNEVPVERRHGMSHIKPTPPVSVHRRNKIKRRHLKKKVRRRLRKSNRRSKIYRKSMVSKSSKRSLPLENPHPKEPSLQSGENLPPAIPETQESNLNVDFNGDSSDLIGKSEVGSSAETTANNTSKSRPASTTEDEENDEEELDDIKPTDSPDDDEVPPTSVTDLSDDSDVEGSAGVDIDADIKENIEAEEDPGDSELDTDEDEDEEADETSPTADPSSEKKAIINGNSTLKNELTSRNKSTDMGTAALNIVAQPVAKTDISNISAQVSNNSNSNSNNATHPAEIARVENIPSDNLNTTSSSSDAEKDFAKLQKLEQDINRIAGDLQSKRNEILQRISLKKKLQNTQLPS